MSSDHGRPISQIVTLIVAPIAVCIELFFIFSLICNSKIEKLQRTHIAAIATFLAAALWNICLLIFVVFGTFPLSQDNAPRNAIFMALLVVSTTTFFCSTHIFMIYRLYIIFHDSVYAMTRRAIQIHVACTLLYPLLIALLVHFSYGYGLHRGLLGGRDKDIAGSVALIVMGCLLIGSIGHLSWMVTHNLFKLILTQSQSAMIRNPDSASDSASSLNERQLTLLNTVTKNTVLGLWMALIFAVSMSFGSLLGLLGMKNDTAFRLVSTLLYLFKFPIVTTCVYLGFSCNEKYYLFICAVPRRNLGKLCEAIAERQNKTQTANDGAL